MGNSFCGLCGKALADRAAFCGNCGRPVPVSQWSTELPPPPPGVHPLSVPAAAPTIIEVDGDVVRAVGAGEALITDDKNKPVATIRVRQAAPATPPLTVPDVETTATG